MATLFMIVYIVWFLSEIILNRRLRSAKTDAQNKDKHSLPLIWITIIITMTAAVFIEQRTPFIICKNPLFQYAGIALILLGIALRILAVVSLGKWFTVEVTIREGHQLKQDGMYRYLRHPSYAASLLSFIGFGMVLDNWLSLVLLIAAVVSVFSYRISIEENVLAAQFGEAFFTYKNRTKRLIPFVY